MNQLKSKLFPEKRNGTLKNGKIREVQRRFNYINKLRNIVLRQKEKKKEEHLITYMLGLKESNMYINIKLRLEKEKPKT